MEKEKFAIKGMTCEHCAMHVTSFNTILVYFLDPIKNIIDLDYLIKEAKVSLKKNEALVKFDAEVTPVEEMAEAVKEAGYELVK